MPAPAAALTSALLQLATRPIQQLKHPQRVNIASYCINDINLNLTIHAFQLAKAQMKNFHLSRDLSHLTSPHSPPPLAW